MSYVCLLNELKLPEAAVRRLERLEDLARIHKDLIEGLTRTADAESSYKALEKVLDGDDMAMLACQLHAACLTRGYYREKGIADRVFLDTMGCFSRFLRETEHRTGKLCFDRGWWSYRQLSMRLFRIGQLEYELVAEPLVISLHIPSDALLTAEAVDASLAEARVFLRDHFPAYAYAPIGCESWLLSPSLRPYLGPDSRIRALQDRFEVTHADPEPKDVWEWLFRVPEETPVGELPEGTSLQRSVKQHLLAGGSIGVARGTMK